VGVGLGVGVGIGAGLGVGAGMGVGLGVGVGLDVGGYGDPLNILPTPISALVVACAMARSTTAKRKRRAHECIL